MINVCPLTLGLCVITFNLNFCTCLPSIWDHKTGKVEGGGVRGEVGKKGGDEERGRERGEERREGEGRQEKGEERQGGVKSSIGELKQAVPVMNFSCM